MTTAAEMRVGRTAAKWTVPTTLRKDLAEARSRGLDFESAWSNATAGLPVGDVAALSSTKPTWRAAYLGLPDTCSTSFDALASTRAA